MCIESKKTREGKKKWLDKKPDTVIAYKAVKKVVSSSSYCSYYPLSYRMGEPYDAQKMNRIKGPRNPIGSPYSERYKPYFHLFMTEKGAKTWTTFFWGSTVVLKCEVPKKHITEVGTQKKFGVIVTKTFKIIEEVK